MKNTINRDRAIRVLNNYFKTSATYNEAIVKFFEGYVCEWMKVNPSLLPTEPQLKMRFNEDGSKRVLPLSWVISEAVLSINQKP